MAVAVRPEGSIQSVTYIILYRNIIAPSVPATASNISHPNRAQWPVMLSPSDEYRARLGLRQVEAGRLAARDRLLSYARLLVFLAGAVVFVLWWRGSAGAWWLALPALAFAALVRSHDRVIRARLAAERSIGFYERGLSRIEDRWSDGGETGERFRSDDHPYANDLDLFGPGSLFQLLSIARTRPGEERLASWLTRAASPEEVTRRQEAVTELTPALDLREELSLAGTDVRAGVNGDALVAWAEGAPLLGVQWLRGVAATLTAAALATAGYGVGTGEYGPLRDCRRPRDPLLASIALARAAVAPCCWLAGTGPRHPRPRLGAARASGLPRSPARRTSSQP